MQAVTPVVNAHQLQMHGALLTSPAQPPTHSHHYNHKKTRPPLQPPHPLLLPVSLSLTRSKLLMAPKLPSSSLHWSSFR